MILTALLLLLPPLALLTGLRHWIYAPHIALVCLASWLKFPSLDYPLWHSFYAVWLGMAHVLSINIVTFAAYGIDKRRAVYGGWRIPEKTLHALAWMGGSIGAWAGSKTFRHKTIKKQFRQMFFLIAGAQVLALVALLVTNS